MFARNYQHVMWFDKVIAKIRRVQFFAAQCRLLLANLLINCVLYSFVIISFGF